AEGARTHGAPLQAELVGQARRQDGVGELLLLAAGLAAGVGVVLVFAVVLAPAFAGGEQEPVAHVGDLGGPAAILLRQAFAAAEAVDDGLDLEKPGLRVLVVVGTGQGAFGAGPQFGLEF